MAPLGQPQIIFIIAILGFALWKKKWIRMVLSICIVIWGVFALPYDVKIAAPLVTAGGLLFFTAVLTLWHEHRSPDET